MLTKPPFSTPGESSYKVRLKDQSGVLVAEFDDWRSLSFSHIVNSPGACRFEIDALDSRASLFELDGQIEVWRRNLDVGLDWYLEWEGFHRTQNDLVQQNDNESFISYALGYLTLINRRHIMYVAGSDFTDKSGAGETVIKEYVNENAGPAALSANGRLGGVDGDITGLTIEADAGNGTAWEGARAYKNLLTVVNEIAVKTGVDIEVVGVGTVVYEFKVHDGQRGKDRSVVGLDPLTGLNGAGNAPVLFTLGFGNMALPLFSINRSTEVNAVYVLGQGEEANRSVILRQDLAAISDSPINRIEMIRNATQETTLAGLNSVGDEALIENQKLETLRFDVIQIEGTFYGKDYTWGDLITARYRDTEFNKKIVDVRVVVSNTQGGENIAIKFGDTP